jgi:hypothetical protein
LPQAARFFHFSLSDVLHVGVRGIETDKILMVILGGVKTFQEENLHNFHGAGLAAGDLLVGGGDPGFEFRFVSLTFSFH